MNPFLPFWAANMLRVRGAGLDWFVRAAGTALLIMLGR